jgi:retron-type reverse transcriptase
MGKWRPHIYRAAASKAGVDPSIVEAAIKAGKVVIAKNPDVPPIFSLGHLAHLSGAPYRYLREIIERQYDPYTIFTIRKRNVKSGFRTICVPPPPLMQLQRWLVDQVLNQGSPHTASTAFAPESSILDAAKPHVGCRWLIKVDIRNFFESISEIAAYRVFHEQFGFQELVSFEMARLCTRKGRSSPFRSRSRWSSHPSRYTKIPSYQTSKMGHLPQGAPTSPMLANLSVRAMDERFQTLAESEGLIYTRYADDLFFSTIGLKYTRENAGVLITKIYRELRAHGFSPNTSKTTVSPPGARKLVVGLAVDGDRPRLRREFKQSVRLHLHHCKRDVAAHAKARKFTAIAGLQNYLQGLLSYAKQIEPEYAERMQKELGAINWPI